MPIKDKEVNKNVINIKIGDIDKKKKGKNKKRKIVQRAKQVGSFNYASSAPSISQRPLHPQIPTQSTHYNRAQEANLSTLIGREDELKQTKEREKTLNSLFDNTASELKKSKDRERQLQSYISSFSNSTNLASEVKRQTPVTKNTPTKHFKFSDSPNLSPIDFKVSSPLSTNKKDKPLNDITSLIENNKKADILLQKSPLPVNDSNNSLYISSSDSQSQQEQQIARKKVTIAEEPKQKTIEKSPIIQEPKVPKISLKELRQVIQDKGFPISYKNEKGKIQMFNKQELLERFNFIELEKSAKRQHEKKPRHIPLLNEDDPEDVGYHKNLFPIQSDFQVEEYTAPISGENELNDLLSGMNLS